VSEAFTKREFVYAPPESDLVIIYEDEQILIVDKPSGLLSVPGKDLSHKDSLQTRLETYNAKVRLVHRLDMSTSGLMVFAKSPNAQRHLGLQFEKRYIQKTYQARVWGQLVGNSGHINLPLIADWPNRPKQKVDFATGKSAQTDWEVIGHNDVSTHLKLYPKTGRSHQLRVHMQAIGHPILGDRIYAPDPAFQAASRLQLQATNLKLRHPDTGDWMNFDIPHQF